MTLIDDDDDDDDILVRRERRMLCEGQKTCETVQRKSKSIVSTPATYNQ